MAERHASLREAFSRLSPCCQLLLTLLIDERHAGHRDQRQAGCPGRQLRADPQPLPGQAPP